MKYVALLFGGHLRTFQYQNILNRFLKPLREAGYTPHLFFSLWDTEGHRNHQFYGELYLDFIRSLPETKTILLQPFDRKYFVDKYNSDDWKRRKHLSDDKTCGDSVSMWYRLWHCWKEMAVYMKLYNISYDLVVRIRPDVLFDDVFDKSIFEECIRDKCIYIPRWHGKWFEVSHTITDYFAIGDYESMKNYFSVYLNVGTIMSQEDTNPTPHTGEGFLWRHLQLVNYTNIKRLKMGFSVKRPNIIDKVVDDLDNVDFMTGVSENNLLREKFDNFLSKVGKDFFLNKKVLVLKSKTGAISKIISNLGGIVSGTEDSVITVSQLKKIYPEIDFIYAKNPPLLDKWDIIFYTYNNGNLDSSKNYKIIIETLNELLIEDREY